MPNHGSQSNVDRIRRMLIKTPAAAFRNQAEVDAQWQPLNYLERPDYALALAEYKQFRALLAQSGAEIHELPVHADTGLDSLYTHDPLLITNRGYVLCNMGKAARRGEAQAAGEYLQTIGVPMLGRIEAPGTLEGGDVVWLDQRTVAVGEGYRSNAAGIAQLRTLLGDSVDEMIAVPLPHWNGPDDVLHLMSFVSPLDHDLFLIYSRLMPVVFRQRLLARGIRLLEVPDAEYDSMACNVLAVAPRECIMLAGNPITQALLQDAGVEVATYKGSEISAKGAGGPTCLTRPFWRG